MYIQFFPTFSCNRRCSYCFNKGASLVPDIGTPAFGNLADVLSRAGIEEIDMLGGEPTLHSDLIALVGIACEKGLRVSISSNGSNVPLLRSLSGNFDAGRLVIGISLHDEVADRDLDAYIREHRPLLKSVCSSRCFLPKASARFIDIPGIHYYAIFMDALHSSDLDKCLSFPRFFAELEELRRIHGNIEGVYCSGFLPDIQNHPELDGVRCPAGTTKLSVMPDGSVYPCYLFFGSPGFRLGNILSDRLDHILKHPALDFFRNFEKNNCTSTECDLFSRCRGGCPAVSFAVCGDLNAPDPRCIADRKATPRVGIVLQ